jgi:hypothetical protein
VGGAKTHHERRGTVGVDRLALGDRHRTEGSPVERALHRDDVLLARDTAYHLERGLDRLRARIYEEERVKGGVWHDGEQTFYKTQIGLVVCDATLITAQKKRGEEKKKKKVRWKNLPVRVQD